MSDVVLVTGSDGFIGKHLVTSLVQNGRYTVRAGTKPGARRSAVTGASPIEIDVRDPRSVSAAIAEAQPTAIIHLAAAARGSLTTMIETNVGSTGSILDGIRNLGYPCRLLLAGSAAEYGRPPDAAPLREDTECRPEAPYGITKLAATTMALAHGRAWGSAVVVFRPFNVVGAGAPPYLLLGALIDRIYAAVESGAQSIVVGRVDTERDFLAVQDVVEAVVRLLESGETGEIFNICSGAPTRVEDVVRMLIGLAAPGLEYRVDPSLVRSDDVLRAYGDPTKLAERTGKRASVPLESALAEGWRDRVLRGEQCAS